MVRPNYYLLRHLFQDSFKLFQDKALGKSAFVIKFWVLFDSEDS